MTGTRALLYECASGISGDMNIGALVDLGVPPAYLHEGLARLPVAGEFTLELAPERKSGIRGTRARVVLAEHVAPTHRGLSDVEAIVRAAEYPEAVERTALAIFGALARAEAHVHGISVEEVHFHEVGATDAIVDVVAAALCREWLGMDAVLCGVVEVGGGTVRCAHGTMPVPAPATAELLRGVPCRYGGVDGEATTPTGAAILRATVDRFAAPEHFVAERVGYGVGTRDFALANVLRATLGELRDAAAAGAWTIERNLEVETNIDDMSPEAFEPLIDAVLAAGAKDVFLTPTVMKKSRPATRLSALVDPDALDAVSAAILAHSTTLGLRVHAVDKRMLPRVTERVETPWGEVRVKRATLPDGSARRKPEHDDVVALAERSGRGYLEVRRAIEAALAAHPEERS